MKNDNYIKKYRQTKYKDSRTTQVTLPTMGGSAVTTVEANRAQVFVKLQATVQSCNYA